MRHLTPNLLRAAGAFFAWSLSYNLLAPFVPLMARQLGATPVEVGYVGAAGLLGAAVLVFPLGLISDRLGRQGVLVTAWVMSGIGMVLMAFAPTVALLIPGAFLSATALAALPSLNVLVLEETDPTKRTQVFSLFYAAGPLGLLLGSVAGAALAQSTSFSLLAIVAGGSCLISVLPLSRMEPRPKAVFSAQAEVAAASPSRAPSLSLVLVSSLAGIALLFVSLPSSFIVLFLNGPGGQDVLRTGAYSSLLGAAQLLWSFLFSVWPTPSGVLTIGSGRFRVTLSRSTLLAIAICLVANAAFGFLMPTVGAGLWALALFLRGSIYSLQSLGSALFGDVAYGGKRPTLTMTGMGIPIGIGSAVAPILGGWLYTLHPAYPFWVAGLLSAGGALTLAVTFLFARRQFDTLKSRNTAVL